MEGDLNILNVEYFSCSSNFKLKLRGPHQNLKCMIWRRPQMEDSLKILKFEYLRIGNHCSDLPQWKKTSNWRRPSMEEDLQWNTTSNGGRPLIEILKVEYLSDHLLDLPQILNSISLKPHQNLKCMIWRQPQTGRWPQNIEIWISQN